MTKSTETEIAVLQTQMTDVKASLEAIKSDQHTNFTALSEKIDNLTKTTQDITTIEARLSIVEESKNKEWIRNTLSAIAGIVLASLIWYAVHKP